MSAPKNKNKDAVPDELSEVKRYIDSLKSENPEAFSLSGSKRTIEELSDYFQKVNEGSIKILPKEKRRYAIYVRKSTDDEAKQVRSLEDQVIECLELAKSQGISVRKEDILRESASAKKSGNRRTFDRMIDDFKIGKYHGLISWSPDRLSRNMKEAGEIIEMIDLEQIQDLLFKTYQFENTPNGKMLLGILFATSKQYSDKLSVDVSRGITGNIRDGKYTGASKKGYYVDLSTGYFVPDGLNWDLLREAVNMRLHKGKTNLEIAEFLNKSRLSIRKSQDDKPRPMKMDKKSVGKMFEDTFYFGLYQYGKNLANLTEIHDFLPLVTPDEYIKLNRQTASNFNEDHVGKSVEAKRLDYGLLRGKVICDFCDNKMQFQHQKLKRGENKGAWFVSFYCRDKGCQRYEGVDLEGKRLKRSIRASLIMAAIEYTLRNCTKENKNAYKYHINKLTDRVAQEKAIAKRKLAEAQQQLKQNEINYSRRQDFQINQPDEYEKHHKGSLEHFQQLINVAQQNIDDARKDIKQLESALPTEEQFYELINDYLLTLLNTDDLIEKDTVCNELVSNLRANNDFVSVIKLNPPYDLLVDLAEISTGRGDRT